MQGKARIAARNLAAVCLLALVAGGPSFPLAPGQGPNPLQDDLDAFMARVLERRDINWDRLRSYIFSEREVLEFRGAKIAALESFEREYVWFVRDGYLVRSPVRFNGVAVSDQEQAAAEEEWLNKSRKQRKNSIDRDAFFNFKFKAGSYLFAGRRDFDGREVVAVEYYPSFAEMTGDAPEDAYESMFEKALLVTMLIAPEEHQIVQITFDTVDLDFLPYRWLVRIDELKASMTMDKPLGDVWLPKKIYATGSVITASASLSVNYSREFYDYAKTDVKVKFWFEKTPPGKPENE